jgi:hypothetical protein
MTCKPGSAVKSGLLAGKVLQLKPFQVDAAPGVVNSTGDVVGVADCDCVGSGEALGEAGVGEVESDPLGLADGDPPGTTGVATRRDPTIATMTTIEANAAIPTGRRAPIAARRGACWGCGARSVTAIQSLQIRLCFEGFIGLPLASLAPD